MEKIFNAIGRAYRKVQGFAMKLGKKPMQFLLAQLIILLVFFFTPFRMNLMWGIIGICIYVINFAFFTIAPKVHLYNLAVHPLEKGKFGMMMSVSFILGILIHLPFVLFNGYGSGFVTFMLVLISLYAIIYVAIAFSHSKKVETSLETRNERFLEDTKISLNEALGNKVQSIYQNNFTGFVHGYYTSYEMDPKDEYYSARYTNEEYYERANKLFVRISNQFAKYQEIYDAVKGISPVALPEFIEFPRGGKQNTYYSQYKIMKSGYLGENKVETLIKKSGLPYMTNVTCKNNASDEIIEMDAVIVAGNKIYSFETKNHNVSEVVLTKAGSLVKIKTKANGEKVKEPMNVVSQVARHAHELKGLLNADVEIVNVIVFASGAIIQDEMGDDSLKLLDADYLPYFLGKIQVENSDVEQNIMKQIKEAGVPERKFTFYNLDRLEKEFETAIKETEENLKKLFATVDEIKDVNDMLIHYSPRISHIHAYHYGGKPFIMEEDHSDLIEILDPMYAEMKAIFEKIRDYMGDEGEIYNKKF